MHPPEKTGMTVVVNYFWVVGNARVRVFGLRKAI
jgi:hypothetical protein